MSDSKGKSPLRWRIIVSLLIFAAFIIAKTIFDIGQGPIEGDIALEQLNGTDAEYAAARGLITSHTIPRILNWIFWAFMAVMWIPPAWRAVGRASRD